jgi:hypothetical protein
MRYWKNCVVIELGQINFSINVNRIEDFSHVTNTRI